MPTQTVDAVERVVFPTPTTRAYALDLGDADLRYPYTEFAGREDPQVMLRRWLLGGDRYEPGQLPRGGAALMTGFRGVGKSTLVDKVLYDVGLSGLLALPFSNGPMSSRTWPFDSQAFAGRRAAVLARKELSETPRLYIPVRIDVANDIKREELLERVLRRTYHTLCNYEVGDLRPDVMQHARLAYLRSLGKIEMSASSKAVEKLQSVLGATPQALSKMEVTATQEREFAAAFKFAADSLSIEETEDEVIELAAALSNAHVGRKTSLFGTVRATARSVWVAAAAQWKEWLRGADGTQVHIVFVFDELDKLDKPRSNVASPADGFLTTSSAVIQQLKILFSSSAMSAIVVAGNQAEEAWLDEVAEDDPLLRSVFGLRVYVPQLTAEEILVTPGVTGQERARALAFRTRGRYKHVQREIVTAGRPEGAGDARLAEITGAWGATATERGTPDVSAYDRVDSLEALVAATRGSIPYARMNAYGFDSLRSFFVTAIGELMVPGSLDEIRRKAVRDRVLRYLPEGEADRVVACIERIASRAIAP